jgi:serine protease inhibitor
MTRKQLLIAAGLLSLVVGLFSQLDLRGVMNLRATKAEQSQGSTAAQQTVNPQLVAMQNKFAFKLYQELLKEDSSQDIFISPSSIAFALTMTYNGASSETKTEIAKALELVGLSPADINSSNLALQTALQNADPKIQLHIANSLWLNERLLPGLNQSFLETNQKYYQAAVTPLDFTDSKEAVKTINAWVQDKTKGKIGSIIDDVSSDHVMFLINAIYFKGNWQNQFDQSQTREQPFYLTAGQTKQHPLMSRKGRYSYSENEQFQAVSLPYGEGRLSMYVFLPKKGSSLSAFQQQLTSANWDQWLSRFSEQEVLVELPRFKLDYDVQLNQALKALGMERAFTESADFSEMTKIPVMISKVKHKTFVEVNEEGTEAAAATSVEAIPTSAAPGSPVQMRVERPFFTVIRDNETGAILFMGAITNPQ